MATSSALQITADNVQAAYIAYFGRPADPAGLNFWLNAGTSQTTMLSIMQDFAQSAEFQAMYGSATGAAFVDAVYMNVFGHHADAAGLNFYANALAAGSVTYGDVVYNIVSGATGTDAAIVANKVAYANDFTSHLAANTLAYVNYNSSFGIPLATAQLASITADPATLTAALAAESGVLSTMAAGPVVPPPSAGVFTLTTGVDNFTGLVGGNNTFNATDNNLANGPTLTNSDVLNGGGGDGNVLNVSYVNNAIVTTSLPGLSVAGIQTANLFTTVQYLYSGGLAISADTNGWDGLTTLNATTGASPTADPGYNVGNIDISAAQTTDVNALDWHGAITINGGNNVVATTTADAITIGDATTILNENDPVTAAGNITVTDWSVGSNNVAVDGGVNVSVKVTGADYTESGNGINIGANTAPTGTVTVNEGIATYGTGNVNVDGGTDVSVTTTGGSDSWVTIGANTEPTGTVDVSVATQGGGTISVTGGTDVTVGTDNGTDGDVMVSGNSGTTTVTDGSQGTGLIQVSGGTDVSITTDGGTGGSVVVLDNTGTTWIDDGSLSSGSITAVGGTDVTIQAWGGTGGGTIGVFGATGQVSVIDQMVAGGATQGNVYVYGGTTVTVTELAANPVNTTAQLGAVEVHGSLVTTSVTVNQTPEQAASSTQAGVVDGLVSITDVNYNSIDGTTGTINTVVLSGLHGGLNTIQDSGLSSLTVNNSSDGAVVVVDPGNAVAPVTDLTLNLDNNAGLTIQDILINPQYTSITIDTSGAASTLTNLVAPLDTSLVITGTADLTIVADTLADNVQIDATNFGADHLTITQPLGDGQGFWGGAEADWIQLGSTTQHITTGAGDDTVYLRLDSGSTGLGTGGSIDGGTGFDNLVMHAGDAVMLSAAPAAVSNFEMLTIGQTTGAEVYTVNLQNLGNINNVTSGGTTGAPGATPTAETVTFTTVAMDAGQSITVEGLTVTAYANASAATVATAIETGHSIPGSLLVEGALSTDFTVSAVNATTLLFTANTLGTGPVFDATSSGDTSAAPTPSDAYTAGVANTVTYPTDFMTVAITGTAVVGSSVTVDGVTVTVLSASATAAQVAEAIVDGNTAGGNVAVTGTLDMTSYSTVSTDGAGNVYFYAATNGTDVNPVITTIGGGFAATPSSWTAAGTVTTGYTLATDAVTFAALTTGETFSVNGYTYVATHDVTADVVAAAAAVIGTGGSYTGSDFQWVSGTAPTDALWDSASASGAVVTFTYDSTSTLDPGSIAYAEALGDTTAPTLVDPAVVAGTTAAPLVLNGYTDGGSLTLTGDVGSDITVNGTFTGSHAFTLALDGGINSTNPDHTTYGAIHVASGVTALTVESDGTSGNVANVDAAGMTTLDITGAADLTLWNASSAHGLTTIDASGSSGAVDVLGMASQLSTSAVINITGGDGLLTAQGAGAYMGHVGLETITSGAGGVTFTAVADATNNGTVGYTFNLANSAAAADTLVFNDYSAPNPHPAIVNDFANYAGTTGAQSDVLVFAGADILASAVGTSGQTGISYVQSNGIITFGGIGMATATLTDLINAAETILTNNDVGPAGGEVAAFAYNGDLYVVHTGVDASVHADDVVVDLVGLGSTVTSLSNGTAGAHTLLVHAMV